MNQSSYVNDTISGLYYEFFDSTQRLVSNFGHYIKGRKEDKWIWYYPNQKTYIKIYDLIFNYFNYIKGYLFWGIYFDFYSLYIGIAKILDHM